MPRGTGTTRLELVLGTGTVEALDAARGQMPRATFVKQALEAALLGDTQAASPGPGAEQASERGGHSHTDSTPARSAPSTARGASRPVAPPRAPARRKKAAMMDPGLQRFADAQAKIAKAKKAAGG